jgi:hypothetical protein
MRRLITLLAVVAVPALAACGSNDGDRPTAPRAAAEKAAAATPALPTELVGTWTMKLKVSDIPDAPNEFNEASSGWELKVLADGGIDGAPSVTLANDAIGAVASSTPTVAGDQIKLDDADGECPPSTYTYAVDGGALTLQPMDMRSECANDVIEYVLTANPWRSG